MPDAADVALRTAARLRLVAFAIRERLGMRETSVVAVLTAPPPERKRKFDALAIRIAGNIHGPLGAEWAASVLETPTGRKWSDDLLLELLAAPRAPS